MNANAAWLMSVGAQSISERAATSVDGVAVAAMIAAADGKHQQELAEAIAALNEQIASEK